MNSIPMILHFRIIAYDQKLSVMLSEVPWMKFKVIAEPDFSVFSRHPVMQSTLVQIANSTVQHVTAKFEALMSAALAETIQVVTQSAMVHIEQSLEVLTENLNVGAHTQLRETYTGSGQLKSGYQACDCKPFQCSCLPRHDGVNIAANGKGLYGIQNATELDTSAIGNGFRDIQNATELDTSAIGKGFHT